MVAIRRLIRKRKWEQPKITEPEPYIIYKPKDLGLPFSKCKGVAVGWCPENEWEGETAHAHCLGYNEGIICVKDAYYLYEKYSIWQPRELMWHEYAHVLIGFERDFFHDDHHPDSGWAAMMRHWGLRVSKWS